MKLLIIEDNPRLAERMKKQLQKRFVIETASTGDEALQHIASGEFDAATLDLGLPDIPGLELCKLIRAATDSLPILVITGIDTTASRVTLLDAGADDYITKPFETDEIVARLHALQRRSQRSASQPLIEVGDLIINRANRHVIRGGVEITLRKKEFDILEYLARNIGRVMSREMIIHHAWPSTSTGWPGSVDVHIKQLRDKVDKPFTYPLIKTSYGVGYMIELPKVVE